MFEILFDTSVEKEKRETAANNLVALAKERAGKIFFSLILSALKGFCSLGVEVFRFSCKFVYIVCAYNSQTFYSFFF